MENLNNGWDSQGEPSACRDRRRSTGKVLCVARLSGCDAYTMGRFPQELVNIYWMRLSEGIKAPWIVATERKPTKGDSDALNCVLARSSHGDISITGFHQFDWNSDLTHWLSPPLPPSDYKELRKMQ